VRAAGWRELFSSAPPASAALSPPSNTPGAPNYKSPTSTAESSQSGPTPAATGPDAFYDYTAFGTTEPDSATAAKYGWEGTHRRPENDFGQIVFMGQRLYNPNTGRLLQTDPIPGGSANAYDYCNQDPINCTT
jgi:RHS repeat-associated protein